MSGIFGCISANDAIGRGSGIKPMLLWNRLYGNSFEDCIEMVGVNMGCCVENLSEINVQNTPILNLYGKHAVIDALLYNRRELLEKCKVESKISDAELLFYYISQFGPNSLKDVNGDFAGAIYNDSDRSLLLFRDHMGIRPLFYYADNGVIAFSTDLRGLIALPIVDATISEDWIYETVSGYS